MGVDGKTSGPNSGDTGKSLLGCENLEITNYYDPIPADLPEVDPTDLSSDQRYLLEICRELSSGYMPRSLANKSPGAMSHSRWLTTANRILRLYVATESPDANLRLLTEFVVKVYVPCWFDIKKDSSCTNGAHHFHAMINRSSYLPDGYKKIVQDVLQRNSYFAHPENIILAKLHDGRVAVRELAVQRIQDARSSEVGESNIIRQFKVPLLDFNATEYYSMIAFDGNKEEPPSTIHLSEEELKHIAENGTTMDIADVPCHSHAVERHIKLVTEASAAVCGEKNRDGFIRTRIRSREQLPRFETKRDFYSVDDLRPQDNASDE